MIQSIVGRIFGMSPSRDTSLEKAVDVRAKAAAGDDTADRELSVDELHTVSAAGNADTYRSKV